MNINEAIDDLSIQLEVKHRVALERQADAIKLGIEVLKRVKSQRADKRFMASMPLPGETEE